MKDAKEREGDDFYLRPFTFLRGGAMNGALLQAGLVDELSLIIAPSVEGMPGGPTVFDIHDEPSALNSMGMELESCQVLEGSIVWLRYRFSWDR